MKGKQNLKNPKPKHQWKAISEHHRPGGVYEVVYVCKCGTTKKEENFGSKPKVTFYRPKKYAVCSLWS